MRLLCVVVVGCGFSAKLDEVGTVDTITLADDTFDGAVIDGVATPDTVEPDGFVLGGLHARGFQTQLVDAGEDFEKVLADAAAATATGAGYAQAPADWAANRPRGLGLTLDNNYSVLWDGEILLPKGTVTLEADVDDHGLVQVALDGATYGELLAVGATGVATITFAVSDAGWYPIRAALSENNGNARFVLTIVQGQTRTAVDSQRLRTRVTATPGLVVYAFDGQGFVGPRGHATRPTIDEAFSVGAPPYDLTASFDRFSLRFAGQLRIDTAGSYMFAGNVGSDADDGFRLWIDGELVAHRWRGHPDVPSAAVTLDAGWHSILVDYADEIGNAEIELAMTGPDAPDGGPIDPARLRPVVVFGNTFTFFEPAATTIVDQQTTFVALPLEGTALTLIDAVDYGFRIDNQEMAHLAVTLFDCRNAGAPLALAASPGYHYYPADRSCAGKPTNPPIDWTLRLTDSVAGNGLFIGPGSIRDYGVSALYRGGPNLPFAPIVTYTSPVRATPGALRVMAARALGKLDDTTVEIAVRTGPDEATLAAAPFEVVRDEPVPAGEVLQYRITLTTNGWVAPSLDKVEIDYVTAGEEP